MQDQMPRVNGEAVLFNTIMADGEDEMMMMIKQQTKERVISFLTSLYLQMLERENKIKKSLGIGKKVKIAFFPLSKNISIIILGKTV